MPHRGKDNTPALVRLTAEALAAVRDEPLDGLLEVLAANAERAFGLPQV
jgi:Tat protein secretion system quality control protein TatD with DNase activity